jgi:hypothetical protein
LLAQMRPGRPARPSPSKIAQIWGRRRLSCMGVFARHG